MYLFRLAKNHGRIDLTCIASDYRQGASIDNMWEGSSEWIMSAIEIPLAPMWEDVLGSVDISSRPANQELFTDISLRRDWVTEPVIHALELGNGRGNLAPTIGHTLHINLIYHEQGVSGQDAPPTETSPISYHPIGINAYLYAKRLRCLYHPSRLP